MKSRNYIIVGFFLVFLFSCEKKKSVSKALDLGSHEGEVTLTQNGKEFIEVSKYLNGSRIKLVTTSGTEITIALDSNLSDVKEVFMIKSLDDSVQNKKVKKYISINEKCEVDIITK